MRQRIYKVEYAGHEIRYSFLNFGTQYNFRNYISVADGDEYDIRITPDLMEIGRAQLPPDLSDSYVEYRVMISETAKELLRFDCCIFHSVAFVFQGYAFLLTAPSGVGKTTQFMNWQRMRPGEIEMICGDMPVLEPRRDGSIWVHSTSWCGKENIGKKGLCAPLAGIVLLEQGDANLISPLPARDAIFPFFNQFVVLPETEGQIKALARLMDRLLSHVPVWKLINLGDEESTELIRETFNKRVQELIGGCDDTV